MEAKQKKQMDLLTAIEQIVEKAKDSKLSPEFYRKASRYIKYVSEKLDLTKEQSVMLALFIEFSCYEDNEVKDISRFLDCSTAKILRYTKEIEDLEKREILRCCREGKHITYRVPTDVIEAFKNDENYIPKRYKDITCAELFGVLEEIFEMRNDKELSYDAMTEKIELLFEDNKNLEYVKYIKSLHLDKDEEMLLVLFTHLFVNNHDNYIRYHDLEFLYDSKAHWSNVKWGLNAGYHRILRKKLVEYNNNNGIVDRESFRVSRKLLWFWYSEPNHGTFPFVGGRSFPDGTHKNEKFRFSMWIHLPFLWRPRIRENRDSTTISSPDRTRHRAGEYFTD